MSDPQFIMHLIELQGAVEKEDVDTFLNTLVLPEKRDTFKTDDLDNQLFLVMIHNLTDGDRKLLIQFIDDPTKSEKRYPGLHSLARNVMMYEFYTGIDLRSN